MCSFFFWSLSDQVFFLLLFLSLVERFNNQGIRDEEEGNKKISETLLKTVKRKVEDISANCRFPEIYHHNSDMMEVQSQRFSRYSTPITSACSSFITSDFYKFLARFSGMLWDIFLFFFFYFTSIVNKNVPK